MFYRNISKVDSLSTTGCSGGVRLLVPPSFLKFSAMMSLPVSEEAIDLNSLSMQSFMFYFSSFIAWRHASAAHEDDAKAVSFSAKVN